MDMMRIARRIAVFAAAFLILYGRFSAGIFPVTEADPFVHFALLPIGALIGAANWAMAMKKTASPARVDAMYGLSAALLGFAVLHWTKVV